MALHLGLRSPIPNTGVEKNGTNTATDQGELFVTVGTTIVHIKFIRNTIGGNGIFLDFLEVSSIIIVEKFTADKEPGVVINDHDTVNPATLSVFGNMRKITGISLPHLAEHILFKGFTVTNIWISC